MVNQAYYFGLELRPPPAAPAPANLGHHLVSGCNGRHVSSSTVQVAAAAHTLSFVVNMLLLIPTLASRSVTPLREAVNCPHGLLSRAASHCCSHLSFPRTEIILYDNHLWSDVEDDEGEDDSDVGDEDEEN